MAKCPEEKGETVDCVTTKETSKCSTNSYPTFRFLRVCLPDYKKLDDSLKDKYTAIYDKFVGNSIGPYISDIGDTWYIILGSVFLCVLISLLYIAAMKVMARVLAWISIVLILIGLVGMGAFFWYLDGKVSEDNPAESHDYYIFAALGCWLVGFLYMIAIFFLWRSLSISIAIIECASDFVGS